MNTEEVVRYLKNYDGPEVKLMEVCGTHTASIFKNGIRSLISPRIRLISGPGCPVCVTPTAYIDRCIEFAKEDRHVLYAFGDMLKVPGSKGSLSVAKGEGAKVELMMSALDAVDVAEAHPELMIGIAAVGFETTIPTYAVALARAIEKGLSNLRFVTALKQTFPAIEWICENEQGIDGFICPGHVSVITGSDAFVAFAEKYKRPFVVAGFEGEHLLAVIYEIVRQLEKGEAKAKNLYPNAVRNEGNPKAKALIERYFCAGSAVWRGLGAIPNSGMYLKEEYGNFDGGSFGLDDDIKLPRSCRCAEVIVGRINPCDCPMFGKACTPTDPYGPCMVSAEGSCGIWYRNTI